MDGSLLFIQIHCEESPHWLSSPKDPLVSEDFMGWTYTGEVSCSQICSVVKFVRVTVWCGELQYSVGSCSTVW